MTTRVCLRCDWSGDTKAKSCPSCGAPLYAATAGEGSGPERGERRERLRRPGRGAERSPATPEPSPTEVPERAVAERPVYRWITVAAIVALAVAALVVVQSNTPDPNAGPVAGLQGVLVYTDLDLVTGRARLWAWDLETGAVQEGPEVDQPLELVDAGRAGPGWIGMIAEGDDETQRASYLDSFDGAASSIPVAEGDLVAWEPLGEHVAAVLDGDGRCALTTISTTDGTEVTSDPTACDGPDAVARSSSETVLGVDEGDTSRIVAAEGTSTDPIVDDATLVGVSEAGRILAVATTCRQALRVQGLCGGLSLLDVDESFVPEDRLVRFGERDASLFMEDLVGWSRFGDRAFVVATYRGVLGLYDLPVPRPSIEVREPIPPDRLLPTQTLDVAVTETPTGELFVARAGTLILIRGTAPLEYLQPPADAPPPDGPILWLSALPQGAA